MASIASDQPSRALAQGGEAADPFVSNASGLGHLRYSNFDTQLFALGPGASPAQAKRALEAHLAETERRMAEAGKLGTALVQQQKELTERLKEVEQLEAEGELTPDLKQKLIEIEKDYNEVARESARAFLPKQRVPSNEAAAGSPYAPEGKGGRRSVSPSKFESQATGSPTKLSVPNRKLRNQPQNRIHDIEFAAEISTSLIAQVRNLQGLLAEREEELRDIKTEKSRLEIEAEGFQQRMKTLDESEHRYKDENWNLETQIHELIASQKEAADREKKLSQALAVLQADKNSTQRELDEVKMNHSKLVEEHAAAVKHHDIELGTAKRNIVMADSERAAMQRKIDDLTSQNSELAKAFSMQRGRTTERESAMGMSDEDFETANDNITPEHSPPPSPVKGTPRHSVLESETLKTSLHHAQRTIQSLRTNVHREKTEKLELKRMLQEARDELEKARGDPAASNRRSRKMDSREFKKPLKLGQLGGARASRSDIYLDDPSWEDEAGSPSRSPAIASPASRSGEFEPIAESSSDHFETADEARETSDAAFETAHERGTETDDFHTGAEEFSDDDDAATETESPSKGAGRIKRPPVLPLNQPGNRYSFQSTASTSNDEDDYDISEIKTPTATMPQQKMRLRVSRGALSRRSRQASEEPNFQSSPASFANSSVSGTPQQPAQSLFAELGDFDGSDDESLGGATPSRRSIRSVTPGSRFQTVSPAPEVPPLPKLIMVDSGVMTDPVDIHPIPTSPASVVERPISMASVLEGGASRPVSMAYSDASAQHDPDMDEKLAQFPSPPTSPPRLGAGMVPILAPPQTLTISSIQVQDIEPEAEPEVLPPSPPALTLSSIFFEHVEPIVEPALPKTPPPTLSLSSIVAEDVEPVVEPERPALLPTLSLSTIVAENVEPVAEPEMISPPPPVLSLSSIYAEEVEPVVEPERETVPIPIVIPEAPAQPPPISLSFSPIFAENVEPRAEPEILPPALSLSSIVSEHVEPVTPPEPEPVLPEKPSLAFSTVQSIGTEPLSPQEQAPPSLGLSTIQSIETEPVSPPLGMSNIVSVDTKPIFADKPVLDFSAIQMIQTEPRSPKRNAFIIPRDAEEQRSLEGDAPKTPTRNVFGSVLGWGKGKAPASPIIAEDDTRQSPSGTPLSETPESQRPLKELSANTNAKPARKSPVPTTDQNTQTALTAEAIDEMLAAKMAPSEYFGHQKTESFASSIGTPGTVRIRRQKSQESVNSVIRTKGKAVDVGFESAPETNSRRPGSSASGRASIQNAPPLPPNHKQVIEAARTGSASGGQGTIGTMGPPLLPASAYRNPALRPRTPSGPKPMSPISITSGRGTPTPRAVRTGSAHGTAEMHSPSRITARSRQSSVSSFVSEIDTRFNMHDSMGLGPHGFGPNTDPRMIQAITQTMIGEYLWKYTRKAGRGEMSENRHRRYFWVHPYTRTLYWSDRDPSSAGRAELKAKSVPIEAVRVVTDDNPMPPGLHRKSLIIIAPGRSVKFTCTTGQRHETWFNALSYLLLRTNDEGQTDTEEMAGNITREDVEEFNPSFGRRPPAGTRPHPPPSLSSYNSRTTRNESPIPTMNMSIPTLTPTPHKKAAAQRPSIGTLGRLSGVWKSTTGTFSSLRSRGSGVEHGIYEASEVHDSAEDLRLMYEKQDRESDRLENVRACCDGKHDVGTLSGKKGRPHAHHSHTHPGPSTTSTPRSTVKSRT